MEKRKIKQLNKFKFEITGQVANKTGDNLNFLFFTKHPVLMTSCFTAFTLLFLSVSFFKKVSVHFFLQYHWRSKQQIYQTRITFLIFSMILVLKKYGKIFLNFSNQVVTRLPSNFFQSAETAF